MPVLKTHQQQIYLRLSILALIIAMGLTAVAVLWKRNPIETSLAYQARTALTEAGLPLVNVHFQGRDGILSGILPNEAALEQIIETVSQIYGVRTVKNQLTISAGSETPAETSPEAKLINGLYVPPRQHALEQLDLSQVQFVQHQAILTEESLPTLNKLAELLNQHPQTVVEISAHTDNRGTVLGQTASTQAKAEAVLQYLLEKGIHINRLTAKGYGATRPIASNEDDTGRAQNRRVEITVLKE